MFFLWIMLHLLGEKELGAFAYSQARNLNLISS